MVVTSLEKVAQRGAVVKEGNAGVWLSPSWLLPYRQPEGLLQRGQRERRRGRESTWALDVQHPYLSGRYRPSYVPYGIL